MPSTYKYGNVFGKAIGFEEVNKRRVFGCEDIVKRLGIIASPRVFIHDLPVQNPVTIFNPGIVLNTEEAIIYARIILGYYMYISSIVEVRVPIEDIFDGSINVNSYAARLAIYPSTRYDIWGTEDPRVYELDGHLLATYVGRTISYFDPSIRIERTLPITAVFEKRNRWPRWSKIQVYRLPEHLRQHVVSDRDAFLVKVGSELYLFHRPHMDDEGWYLLISRVPAKALHEALERRVSLQEVVVENPIEVARPAPFEIKLGWATPPIVLKPGKIIALVHGVDREIEAYRVFALELELKGDEVTVLAVTPTYIMEPRMPYEIFGDRPYTIFPCGLWKLEQNRYIVSYGAGDYVIGLGMLDLDTLLSHLDKGRIY